MILLILVVVLAVLLYVALWRMCDYREKFRAAASAPDGLTRIDGKLYRVIKYTKPGGWIYADLIEVNDAS